MTKSKLAACGGSAAAVLLALWFLLGAWMLALQYIDYPLDNHGRSFAEVKRALRAHRPASLGFGAAVALATSLPLVNFIVIPAAMRGAVVFWCEEPRKGRGARKENGGDGRWRQLP